MIGDNFNLLKFIPILSIFLLFVNSTIKVVILYNSKYFIYFIKKELGNEPIGKTYYSLFRYPRWQSR